MYISNKISRKLLFCLTIAFLIIGMGLVGCSIGCILEFDNCNGLKLGLGIGLSLSALICFKTLRYIIVFDKQEL
jgi:uncharacterized membrane protein YqjE